MDIDMDEVSLDDLMATINWPLDRYHFNMLFPIINGEMRYNYGILGNINRREYRVSRYLSELEREGVISEYEHYYAKKSFYAHLPEYTDPFREAPRFHRQK